MAERCTAGAPRGDMETGRDKLAATGEIDLVALTYADLRALRAGLDGKHTKTNGVAGLGNLQQGSMPAALAVMSAGGLKRYAAERSGLVGVDGFIHRRRL